MRSTCRRPRLSIWESHPKHRFYEDPAGPRVWASRRASATSDRHHVTATFLAFRTSVRSADSVVKSTKKRRTLPSRAGTTTVKSTTEAPSKGLAGYAEETSGYQLTVLQMNKNGIHHLLAARAQEPMTEEILLQIANSMAPAPYPTYSEVGEGTLDSPLDARTWDIEFPGRQSILFCISLCPAPWLRLYCTCNAVGVILSRFCTPRIDRALGPCRSGLTGG